MKVKPSSNAFQLYNTYYDLLYQDKDYLKEGQYVYSLIREFSPGARSIVELGSGTGNYSAVFSDLGFKVTGIEKSQPMIDVANAKGIRDFHSLQGDIAEFNVEENFDIATSLFHVISYLTENQQVLSCFRQVSKHLNAGGLFIFDVWYTPAVYSQVPETRYKAVENEEVHITRIARPKINFDANTVDLEYRLILQHKSNNAYEAMEEFHCMRHFSTPEIKMFAELAGLTLLRSEEFLTAKQPGSNTWGVCYILQKNA
ncbi:class I SAM-dependent methyltransferase [Segetibacter sp. 3557_3]|uniref:class I SAM-dependent DNA methyltransferase n=1 Tax=Segetibacter sp. 3557_3 TaxID=2547429 RepID=UPI001058AE64|nr:class I SAM-dependent methyltransferase [Segetibacter sp. 3557_3]TDH27831.1 class I SAM-dependent methyltransferase [Segetibacter sp. 3557_3]